MVKYLYDRARAEDEGRARSPSQSQTPQEILAEGTGQQAQEERQVFSPTPSSSSPGSQEPAESFENGSFNPGHDHQFPQGPPHQGGSVHPKGHFPQESMGNSAWTTKFYGPVGNVNNAPNHGKSNYYARGGRN